MKYRISFWIFLLSLLIALAGCDLYQGINIAWNIDAMGPSGPNFTRVSYTVQNLGKFDLSGVNLQVGVDVNGDGTYPARAWTPDFSIGQNQILRGSIDVLTGPVVRGGAMVLSVDMDKPKG